MANPGKRSNGRVLGNIGLLSLVLVLCAFTVTPIVQAGWEGGLSRGSAVVSPAQAQVATAIQRVVDLTNQERAKQGLPALTLNSALCTAAQAHSQDMATHRFFSHVGSNGSTFDQRIAAAGYSPIYYAGENIAAGQPTPEEVVAAWMNSEGHRENILNPNYRDIGVGFVYDEGSPYRYYWTQEFGSHGSAPPAATATQVPPTATPTRVPPTATPTRTPLPPPPAWDYYGWLPFLWRMR